MGFLLAITTMFFGIAFLVEKVTNLVKQLKSSGSARLNKGFTTTLSVTPIHRKSEESAGNTSSLNDTEK